MKKRPWGSLKRATVGLLIVLFLGSQLGCDRQPAIDLAKVGLDTSTTLFNYYEALAQSTNDTREMEFLWVALIQSEQVRKTMSLDPCNPRPAGAPARPARAPVIPIFTPNHQKNLNDRVDQLRSRTLMAKELLNFISALKDYSESDPGAKVEDAANKLGDAISSLIPIPGVAAAVPLLSGVAGDLKRWRQYKNIKDRFRVVQRLLSNIREFYDQEKDAYTAIMQDNSTTSAAALKELVKMEWVLVWPLFERLPEPYGMKWAKTVEAPETRDEFKCAFIKVVEFRNERTKANVENATENLGEALGEFDTKITEFLARKTISWDSVTAALGRAKFYVGEINKMRLSKEEEK
jgi:hypothetical protein